MDINQLPSEVAAVAATIDPDAYTPGAKNSDWIDMDDFEAAMFVLMVGDWPDTDQQVSWLLQEATSSGGAGAQTLKAGTTLTSGSPAAGDIQAVLECRRADLTINSGYRYVRAVATIADTGSPADSPSATANDMALLGLGFWPRHAPAYDSDLASVQNIEHA